MEHLKTVTSQSWQIEGIEIGHNVMGYKSSGLAKASNDNERVRMHFGLQGGYSFYCPQLGSSYDLLGHHNNLLYTKGLDLEVINKSECLETFGINFTPEAFIKIGQSGNDMLKAFTEKVIRQENVILSPYWQTNHLKMQEVIQEIIHCQYSDALKDLFLLSKSIELLVLQADLYQNFPAHSFIQSSADRKKLLEARELLEQNMENPPTIVELSKLVGINEFKLKKGFKELFHTTVFGFVFHQRMSHAKRLLLDTHKPVKEIAYEIGYSSPQHFSNAFRRRYGVAPNRVRKNPDVVRSID
ncbi:hypothetical protein BKI52_37875 [marine bacterium AO1-C]|nr:hypothetical protein BKI52_37875 [marine bacterium AO1-C]